MPLLAVERGAVGRDAVERFGAVRFGAERFAVGRFALRDGEAFRAAGRRFAELRAALELLRAVDRFAAAPRLAALRLAGLRAPLRFAAAGRRAAFFFDEDLRAGERFEDFDDLRAGDFFDDEFLDDFLDAFLDAAIGFLLFKT